MGGSLEHISGCLFARFSRAPAHALSRGDNECLVYSGASCVAVFSSKHLTSVPLRQMGLWIKSDCILVVYECCDVEDLSNRRIVHQFRSSIVWKTYNVGVPDTARANGRFYRHGRVSAVDISSCILSKPACGGSQD